MTIREGGNWQVIHRIEQIELQIHLSYPLILSIPHTLSLCLTRERWQYHSLISLIFPQGLIWPAIVTRPRHLRYSGHLSRERERGAKGRRSGILKDIMSERERRSYWLLKGRKGLEKGQSVPTGVISTRVFCRGRMEEEQCRKDLGGKRRREICAMGTRG